MRRAELLNQRFNKLTVVEFIGVGTGTQRGALWLCRCDCGNTTSLSSSRLKNAKSCGGCKSGTPGVSTSRLYEAWTRARCTPEGVVDAWASFDPFKKDMGERPSPQHVLMRKDPTQPFGKDNCFWATRAEVSANLEQAVHLTWNGETKTILEWAEARGLSKGIIKKRLAAGWSIEDTLSRSPGPFKRLQIEGERFGMLTVLDCAGLNKHSQTTWRCRCDCGTETVVGVSSLRNGNTRSCGCLRKNQQRQLEVVPGTFRCTKCKDRKPIRELLAETNYRCTTCGLPQKSFSLARRLWRRAKERAPKFGREFTIHEADVQIPEYCPVLGVRLRLEDRDATPTLDRIDNNLGYIPGNVAVISWRANSLKRDASLDELERLVEWLRKQRKIP